MSKVFLRSSRKKGEKKRDDQRGKKGKDWECGERLWGKERKLEQERGAWGKTIGKVRDEGLLSLGA